MKKSLEVFYDKENILRVKGRFSYADVDYNVKHPTLLHNELYFTELVVWSAHKRVLHGGVNNTLNFIRNDYWLCKGRKTVRAILNKCVTCKKSQSRTLLGPEPSDLPKFRLDFNYAFCNIGVDFAGPLYLKDIYGENDQMFKSYICLFTCATTRNVHFELTPSMDASDVIKALVRLLSRRGCIKMFISHNFSSFKSDEVSTFLLLHNINWKFILPLSPWWGGFYERLVRTVKNILRKILGRSKLNFEELYTILTQVECILNSRPLSYVYAEENCEPITPSHLLLERNLQGHWFSTTAGDENSKLNVMKCKKRYNCLLKLINDLWKRFKREYNKLRQQQVYNYRRYIDAEKLVLNDMVLIKNDAITPWNKWKKNVIDELIKGSDGKVRGATLRVCTKDGKINLIKRDIKSLIPLELHLHEVGTRDRPNRRNAAANADLMRRMTDE